MSFIVKKTLSRLACVQATYQWLHNDKKMRPYDYMDNVIDFFKNFQFADANVNKEKISGIKMQKSFANDLIILVSENFNEIKKDYESAIEEFNFEHLEELTQATLFVAGSELKYMKDKHENIVIDEFTQIAHMLLTYKGQNLVNLAVDKLAKFYNTNSAN